MTIAERRAIADDAVRRHFIVHCAMESTGRIQLHKMLSSEHCLARAERLRILMLTASDPAAAIRLRGLVKIYRDLAEHAKKDAETAPAAPPL
jgi:hypothetical protein